MAPDSAALLAAAHRILVFTGAGISTGSGIPDFRGPQGVRKKRQPVYFDVHGLHQAAGSSPALVLEVHGTNRQVECVACGQPTDPDAHVAAFLATRRPPHCACGGFLKFATISFGQALRPGVIERAMRAASGADLALSLGSTLSVQPAASIPLAAVRAGAPYVVINRGETDHDHLATLRLEGDVAELLPPAVAALS